MIAPDLVRSFDSALLVWVAGWQGTFSNAFFIGLTWAGSIMVLMPLALAGAAWASRRSRPKAAFLPLALALSSLTAFLLKLVIDRPRPDLFPPLSVMPADSSFPSAHSMQITAFVLALWLTYSGASRWRWPLALVGVVLILLVGYSRLHLQVHFPSDVLAGVVLAAVLTLGLHAAVYPACPKSAA